MKKPRRLAVQLAKAAGMQPGGSQLALGMWRGAGLVFFFFLFFFFFFFFLFTTSAI